MCDLVDTSSRIVPLRVNVFDTAHRIIFFPFICFVLLRVSLWCARCCLKHRFVLHDLFDIGQEYRFTVRELINNKVREQQKEFLKWADFFFFFPLKRIIRLWCKYSSLDCRCSIILCEDACAYVGVCNIGRGVRGCKKNKRLCPLENTRDKISGVQDAERITRNSLVFEN